MFNLFPKPQTLGQSTNLIVPNSIDPSPLTNKNINQNFLHNVYNSGFPSQPIGHNSIPGHPVSEYMYAHSATKPSPTLVPSTNIVNPISVSTNNHINAPYNIPSTKTWCITLS